MTFRFLKDRPIIKVPGFEAKWYHLELHHPDGKVDKITFDQFDRGAKNYSAYERLGSAFLDHNPNPAHVLEWAIEKDYDIDNLSMMVMIAEWRMFYFNEYEENDDGTVSMGRTGETK